MRGALSHVWFDRHKISQDCLEHLESIDSMCDHLSAIVQDEIRAGIPKHRMVIGMATGLSLPCPLHNSLSSPNPSISPYLIAFSDLHTLTLHLFQIKQSLTTQTTAHKSLPRCVK